MAFLVFFAQIAEPALSPAAFELAPGSRVAFEGDSLIYGQDETQAGNRPPINGAGQKRSASPLPEHLDELLGHRVRIENRGFPGDRTVDGLRRWTAVAGADLVFIMYGTNDALNFGGHPDGVVTPEAYADALKRLVLRRQQEGATVVLMTPPPIGVAEWEARVSPYRAAAVRVADDLGIAVVDTPEILSGVPDKWVDGLHLSEQALKALADFLNDRIRVAESAQKQPDAR